MFSFPASVALGYLIGSLPAAYLVVRWKSRIDIRQAGSGNVGTLNSFVVTRSKLVGGLVLVLDVSKGLLAVWLSGALIGEAFEIRAAAAAAAVLGHNFPVWLGFRGGRGLATAAGAFLAISWPVVPAWCAVWGVAYVLLRSVNPANVVASLAFILAVLASPAEWLASIAPADGGITAFRIFVAVIMTPILVKHVPPVLEFVRERRTSAGTDRSAGEKP